jgi:hypothetical protein
MVELGDDHQSLAETSLGEYTAGGLQEPNKRNRKSIRPLGSFDENSLYTTPYLARPEQDNVYTPSSQQHQGRPRHTPKIDWKINDDEQPSFSDSSTTTDSTRRFKRATLSAPIHLQRQTYSVPSRTGVTIHPSSSAMRRSIPIDVDSVSPFYDDTVRITKIEPLSNGLSTVNESDVFSSGINSDFDDEFTRDASELDVW